MIPPGLRALAVVGALAALAGALVAVVVACLGVNACDPGCDRARYDIQLILAIAGVLPAALLVSATSGGQWRHAAVALGVGLVIYAVWGLLATRGWNNL
jgi:hypothetical protein